MKPRMPDDRRARIERAGALVVEAMEYRRAEIAAAREDGFTIREIAECLGTDPGTAWRWGGSVRMA